jgi:WD40 repeat-containing protein SMU1
MLIVYFMYNIYPVVFYDLVTMSRTPLLRQHALWTTFNSCSPHPGASTEIAVNSVLLNPFKPSDLLVCTRSNAVHGMTTAGTVTKTWTTGHKDGDSHFVAATVSPRGGFLYALGSDGRLYCFNIAERRLDHVLEAHGAGAAIGAVHHPHRNLVVTFADEPELKMWQA